MKLNRLIPAAGLALALALTGCSSAEAEKETKFADTAEVVDDTGITETVDATNCPDGYIDLLAAATKVEGIEEIRFADAIGATEVGPTLESFCLVDYPAGIFGNGGGGIATGDLLAAELESLGFQPTTTSMGGSNDSSKQYAYENGDFNVSFFAEYQFEELPDDLKAAFIDTHGADEWTTGYYTVNPGGPIELFEPGLINLWVTPLS